MFDRALAGVAQMLARYVHRHHGVCAPFYRPLIAEELWAVHLARPPPLHMQGRAWATPSPGVYIRAAPVQPHPQSSHGGGASTEFVVVG